MMMFPITDPSRADDIRMRRRRAVGLLIAILAVPILISRTDKAALAPIHLSFDKVQAPAMEAGGDTLLVSLPCADRVTLVPKPELSRRVVVTGSARGTRGVRLTNVGSAIELSGGCGAHGSDLVVQAPAGMPLTLLQVGEGDIHVGAFSGPVHLQQHGGGDVAIARAGSLDGASTGSGDLAVGELAGDLRLTLAGSGDLAIRRIQAGAVVLNAVGSGDIVIPAGHIGHLDVVLRGSGDLTVGAEIADAAVQAGENSEVTLPHVTGQLRRQGIEEAADRP